jgi:hypothetical protein
VTQQDKHTLMVDLDSTESRPSADGSGHDHEPKGSTLTVGAIAGIAVAELAAIGSHASSTRKSFRWHL